jgi:hypothetical protein
MATKKLTALQIFKETKRLDNIENKAKNDRRVLRNKIIEQEGRPYNEKLVVNGVVYKLTTSVHGGIYIEELGKVEEFNKLF